MTFNAFKPESVRFTVLLGILAALPALSIDVNAPTLLTVQHELVARPGLVGLTITLFMVGFALGQLGAGPMSDRLGRRPVLLTGLVFYITAAAGCALSGSVHVLVGWRLLQGVGAGSCAVLAFTIIHDLFEGDSARSKRSYVTVVFGLAPMLAPGAGAWILDRAGWRPIFVVLAVAGIVLLAAVGLGLAESRNPGFSRARPISIHHAYGRLMRNRRFLDLAIVNALSFGAMFAYIAGSPLVLMGAFHLSAPGYGAVFAGTAAALTAGAWVSGRCARAGLSSRRLLNWSLATKTLASAVLAVTLLAKDASLEMVIPVLVVILFCRGLVAPNAQHLALEPIREDSGSAAAAVGVLQILTGAVSSGLVAFLLPVLGPFAMSGVMAVMAFGSWALWLWISVTPEHHGAGPAVAVVGPGV